jgi:FkbM family methyltransferase
MRAAFWQPGDVIRRYVTNSGDYPAAVTMRTPVGKVTAKVNTHHDVRTAVEIFARGDYAHLSSDAIRCVVDIGANIGISALYFASRNPSCQVYAYEPSPINHATLEANAASMPGQIHVVEKAVSDSEGTMPFNAEPIGRYSGLVAREYTRELVNVVEVEVLHIDDVLRAAIDEHGEIDVLKVDTEGSELPIVLGANPELLAKVRTIFVEANPSEAIHPGLFRQAQHGEICQLVRMEGHPSKH